MWKACMDGTVLIQLASRMLAGFSSGLHAHTKLRDNMYVYSDLLKHFVRAEMLQKFMAYVDTNASYLFDQLNLCHLSSVWSSLLCASLGLPFEVISMTNFSAMAIICHHKFIIMNATLGLHCEFWLQASSTRFFLIKFEFNLNWDFGLNLNFRPI